MSPSPNKLSTPPSTVIVPAHPAETTRLAAALFFVASTGLLIVASVLTPESKGYGTHEQLGLPACSFKRTTALPCPSCHMTTAFAYVADGHLIKGFTTQPAGALLALGCALVSLVTLWSLISGMSLTPLGNALFRPKSIVIALVIFFGAWGYTLTQAILTS